MHITRELLRELFNYEPSTGWLMRRTRPANCTQKGDIAGSVSSNGYINIMINGKQYKAHRIVWLYHFGTLPEYLDHINRNKLDNRLENLRPATKAQNMANRSRNTKSSSRFKGVRQKRSKWMAQARIDGEKKYLGSFSTQEDAHRAYCSAMQKEFGEYFAP